MWTPETRTTKSPYCPQLSMYASVEYIWAYFLEFAKRMHSTRVQTYSVAWYSVAYAQSVMKKFKSCRPHYFDFLPAALKKTVVTRLIPQQAIQEMNACINILLISLTDCQWRFLLFSCLLVGNVGVMAQICSQWCQIWVECRTKCVQPRQKP